MTRILGDPVAQWAIAIIVVLPVLIVITGEVQERLRQRGSPLERPLGTLRNLVTPLLALWALLVLVFDADGFWVQVLATAVVIAAATAALQVLRFLAQMARDRGRAPGRRAAPELVLMLPRLAIVLVAAWLLVATVWNVNVSGLFAALGVTSLIVSLALQDTLSGLASGFLLLGDRPFSPGDWISVDGTLEGEVVDVHWRSTRIRTRDDDLVVVPNATLAQASIVNYSEPTRVHRVKVPVQVDFSNAPTSAEQMLLAAARATPGVLSDPAPVIRVVNIDDPLMGYEAHLWIDDYAIAPQVSSDFGALVWYQSHRMGVPLPSPAFELYHHDAAQEAAAAVPTPERLAERLRAAPLLSRLEADDMTELAQRTRLTRFRQGEIIRVPGATDGELYVLAEGTARMTVADAPGRSVDIATGEPFGLLRRAAAGSSPVVVATTDCEVLVIDSDVAGKVTSRNPQLAEAMNQLMESRWRRLYPQPAPTHHGNGLGGES